MDTVKILINEQVLWLAGGIFALLWGAGKVPISKTMKLGKWWLWRDLLPVLPLLLGVAGAFLPGVVDMPPEEWGIRIVFGLWTGFVAAHGRKILKRGTVDRIGPDKKS
jgi:hypothetical protein